MGIPSKNRMNVCYIPEDVVGFYRSETNRHIDPFENKATAVKMILSIYYDYQVSPTEYNDYEPHDPHGLGIFETMCMKLVMFPEHTHNIRKVYETLHELHEDIRTGRKDIVGAMNATFTLRELEDYGL